MELVDRQAAGGQARDEGARAGHRFHAASGRDHASARVADPGRTGVGHQRDLLAAPEPLDELRAAPGLVETLNFWRDKKRIAQNGMMPAFERVIALVFVLLAILPLGCATSPEQKAADDMRKIAAEQRKLDSEQKHWQQVFAPYTDAQLRFKLAGLEQAVARGTKGMNILLASGNGIGALIAQGQTEGKVKERDAVGLELSRRLSIASTPPSDGKSTESDTTSLKGSGSGVFNHRRRVSSDEFPRRAERTHCKSETPWSTLRRRSRAQRRGC